MFAQKQLLLCAALLFSSTSCGGGSVATTPLQSTQLASPDINPCANFPTATVAAGTVVAVSASDAASFPNAASCAEEDELQSGAILEARAIPESEMDTVVGLNSADDDAAIAEIAAGLPSTAPSQTQPVNATAFAIDANGAVTELVVTGDPSQTQAELDEWAGEQKAAMASRRVQSASGFADAWTTMLTREVLYNTAEPIGAGLGRTTSIYRLNTTDYRFDNYLVTNQITTKPNKTPCSGAACARAIDSRTTSVDLVDGTVQDNGPESTDAATESISIGEELVGGDSTAATYTNSWPQSLVEEHNLSENGASSAWEEIFPNDLAAFDPPPTGVPTSTKIQAAATLSFNSTNRFTSYNATIFRVPILRPNPLNPPAPPRIIHVKTEARWSMIGNSLGVYGDVLDSTFTINPPRFDVTTSLVSSGHVLRVGIDAINGNGGVLRWRLVNPTPLFSVAPSTGSGFGGTTVLANSSQFAVYGVLEFDTIPTHAAQTYTRLVSASLAKP